MERAAAIKKLTKILGKSMGCRADLGAPDREGREEARAKLAAAAAERDLLSKQKNERMRVLLDADPEYCQLKRDCERLGDLCQNLSGEIFRYRFTAGTANAMFFRIRAQGDTWEEVISKLTGEKARG